MSRFMTRELRTADRPLSAAFIKWAAVLTMLIDHMGASLIEVFILDAYGNSPAAEFFAGSSMWTRLDTVLRCTGRISFPLFCFLISEGAAHTRDAGKYLFRLCVFALISEIPFDLAFRNEPFYFGLQNVFFTLALGLAAVLVLQRSATREWRGFLALLAAMAAAELLNTDYGAAGVAVIFVMYYFRDRAAAAAVFSYVILIITNTKEVFCLPAFILIALYNGKRGRQPKHFFYWFYPAHLTVFWITGAVLLPALMS